MDNELYTKEVLKETAEKLVEIGDKKAILSFIDTLINNIDYEKIINELFKIIVEEKRNE